jgi:hypothetical protein
MMMNVHQLVHNHHHVHPQIESHRNGTISIGNFKFDKARFNKNWRFQFGDEHDDGDEQVDEHSSSFLDCIL